MTNRRVNAGIPYTGQIAGSINTLDERVCRAWKVHLLEGAVFPDEPVESDDCARRIKQVPVADNGAGVIDSVRVGVAGAREIERGHHSLVEQEAVGETIIPDILSGYVAVTVDLEGFAVIGGQDRFLSEWNEFPV